MKIRKYKDRDDSTLLKEIKAAVAVEFAAASNVVEYLMEVELRSLHLSKGYDSMFEFCLEYLGYTRAEAHLRIQAARLGQDVPEICHKIESGEISLSVAAIAQSTFRKENQKRKKAGQKILNRDQKQQTILELQKCTQDQAENKLAEIFQLEKPKKKAWIEIDDELDQKLKELKGLYAHKNFDGDLTKLVKIMVDIALAQARKDKPKAESTAQNTDAPVLRPANCSEKSQPKPAAKRARYISIKVKREVWRQAGGRCTFKDPATGKRCNGTHGLQIDHIHEFARGGGNEAANLRLLCGAHNRFRNMQI